ncbi:hypothetical protein [Streptomyces sp. NPDC057579]|uniref:hypothetical protein n=1 Tax=Streptomyces sp. NPDC057579 TaxID=3346172 RepID=UPI0036BE82EB
MRTRLVLASATMGAALLIGGAVATAQATPASADISTTTTTAPIAYSWIRVGTYNTHFECYTDGQNSAYSKWQCRPISRGRYELWVDNAS